MSQTALALLQETFGYSQFRPFQEQIIDTLIAGQDALVLMPTGGGKSLCYQIPGVLRQGLGVVISPLIALMEDQVTALCQLGIKAAYLNSTLPPDQQREVLSAIRQGELDLLYLAPERFSQHTTLSLLDDIEIALFAIDEAHCVSQWGHDFREDYLRLSILHERYPHVPRVALTATADERTRIEICQQLSLSNAKQFVTGFDRPNIQYRVTEKNQVKQQLLKLLREEHAGDSGIVYCLSRKKVDDVANWLNLQGFSALPYHAGLPPDERAHNQSRFIQEEGIIIVATIAFGMGIDKPDVRFVAHMDLPKSLEAYYQETGRAGRDGLPATAWMAYGIQDVITLRSMLDSSQGNNDFKISERRKLDAMLGYCEISSCRREALLHYFGDLFEAPCNNCDTCLEPVETWDATEAAQKALSCVYRTGQRFGVGHVLQVLLGRDTDKIRQFGHQQLSTYGIGKDIKEPQWRSVFRQLVARGYLEVDHGGYGSLLLTEKARPILRGDEKCLLRKDRIPQAAQTKRKSFVASDSEQPLWDALRSVRANLAKQQGVPPYVIFHDATLMEMVESKPTDKNAFASISGVGQAKLERYATDFIDAIANHLNNSELSSAITKSTSTTVNQSESDTLELLNTGCSVKDIAAQRGLAESTIFGHCEKLIARGEADLNQVVELVRDEIDMISDALISVITDDNQIPLAPVFEHFNQQFSYETLRCVRAHLKLQMAEIT
ncbi:DNA helicase RecQ [Aurantivibrio plasticivorans]